MKFYVIEYSCVQQQFHTDTVGRMLDGNLKVTLKNKVPGYIPIWITDSMEEADAFIAKLRPFVESRPLPVNPISADFPGCANVTAGISNLTIEDLMKQIDG